MIKQIAFLMAIVSSFVVNAQVDYDYVPSGEDFIKGYNHLSKGEYDGAIKYFEKIHQSDTNYHLAQYNKIIAQFNNKQYAELEITALKSIQNENEYTSDIYYWYIESLIKSKSYEKANKTILTALNAFPLYFEYEYQSAMILIDQKKLNEAIKLLHQILNIHPQHSKSHYSLAKIKADQGYITEAILGFEMAIISNRLSSVLQQSYIAMEDLMNNNYKVIDKHKGENSFKTLDQMIQSKIALKGNYKSKLGLSYMVDRQTDLLMSQFSFKANSNSFGMNYYGKFFNEVISKGFQKSYILYILGVVTSAEIDKKEKKNAVELKAFKTFLKKYWHDHQNKFKYPIKGVSYSGEYNYNYKGELFGIGTIKDKLNVGEWTFFYRNGVVKSKLNYNQNGELDGDCNWFDVYGNNSQTGKYKNGGNEGFAKFTRANNCNWYSGNFVNNKLDGEFKLFRSNGTLLELKTLKDNKLNGPWIEYSESGTIIGKSNYTDGKFNGEYKEFYDNGTLYSESNNLDGKADGAFKKYHLNGKLEAEGQFKTGNRIGKWKTYYYDGSLRSEYEYNKKGNVEGWLIKYDTKGDTTSKVPYSNGLLNGIEFDYGFNNKPVWEHHYKKGKLKKYVTYDSLGVVLSSGKKKYVLHDVYGFKYISATLKKGKFNGVHSTYWKNGNLKKTITYENGILNGEVNVFFESGELEERRFLKQGNYHGKFESFHLSGKKYAVGYYSNGDKIGEWKFYNPNGSLSQVEFFSNGELDGILVELDNEGVKQYETKYEGGVVVRTDVFNTEGSLIQRFSTPSGNGDYSLVSPLGNKRLSGRLKGGNQDGKLTYFFPNGKVEEVRTRINGVYHGEKLVYHTNGLLRSKGEFIHGYKEGKFVSYHYNGNKYWEATFEHGVIRDSSVYYYESGEKKKCNHYDFKGDEVKHVYYHKNGKISSIEPIVNGFIHGIRTRYDENGMLMVSRKYNGGECVAYSYMKDGSLLPYVSIKKDDKFEPKYNNGIKSEEHNIKDGFHEGYYARYFSNGNIWIEANYKKGEAEGKYSEFYANGKLKSQGDYSLGELNGLYVEFYSNGQIKMEATYLFGSLHGTKKYFTKEGKLINTITYNDNVVIDIK